MPPVDNQETDLTRSRYNRIAGFYDIMEILPEMVYQRWRQRVWDMVRGTKVIEVGVGTGKNMPYYPSHVEVIGIDISDKMLAKAHQRAGRLETSGKLLEMDVQNLDFTDDTFDTGLATFVFCSVPDPILGLRELGRVVKSSPMEISYCWNICVRKTMRWRN